MNGTTTTYLLDGESVVREVIGGTPYDTLHGPAIDQPLARSGKYFTPNQLGSTTTLTNASGTVVQSYSYGPFGETTGSGSENNPFQYAGRENDGSSLYYNRARYYRPEWGRFISEDPLGIDAGTNQYSYTENNPLRATDPLGHQTSPNTPHGYAEISQLALEEASEPGASGLLRDTSWWKFPIKGMQRHHLLPRQFRPDFRRIFGQDLIDKYTLEMPDWANQYLHYVFKWNQRWQEFLANNPNASPLQVIRFTKQLLKEARLGDVRIRELVPWKD